MVQSKVVNTLEKGNWNQISKLFDNLAYYVSNIPILAVAVLQMAPQSLCGFSVMESKKMLFSVLTFLLTPQRIRKIYFEQRDSKLLCLTWNLSQGGKAAMWNVIVEHI